MDQFLNSCLDHFTKLKSKSLYVTLQLILSISIHICLYNLKGFLRAEFIKLTFNL